MTHPATAANGSERPIALIAAGIGWGAALAACERGPAAVLERGLVNSLEEQGVSVASVTSVDAEPLMGGEQPADVEAVIMAHAAGVAGAVASAVSNGQFPVTIGGDHTTAIGHYAGLSAACGPLGVIWVDAHPDLNTPETSPSGNIHGMVLSGVLGQGSPAMRAATAVCEISSERVTIVGARSIDAGEQAFIDEHGVRCVMQDEVASGGLAAAIEEAVTRAGDAFGLTVDLDVIDPSQAPFVSTPVADGIELDDLLDALRTMPHRDRLCGLEVTEIADDGDMAVARDMVAAIIAAVVCGA